MLSLNKSLAILLSIFVWQLEAHQNHSQQQHHRHGHHPRHQHHHHQNHQNHQHHNNVTFHPIYQSQYNNSRSSLRLTLVNSNQPSGNGLPSLFNRNNNNWWTSAPRTLGETTTWRPIPETPTITLRKLDNQPSSPPTTTTTTNTILRGPNVCREQKTVYIPVKTQEVYNKSTLRPYSEPCHNNNICTGVRVVHEPAYRDVIRHQSTQQIIYNCCPGWERKSSSSRGCKIPVCKIPCKNGGKCIRPDTCSCAIGFTGKYCERDINECKEEKPCDQMCYNTEGSYYCRCREGFLLQADRQSCKKINDDGTALEARELESNDIDYEEINSRITKLEKMLNSDNSVVMSPDVKRKVDLAMDAVNSLRVRMDTLEHRQQELYYIREKLKSHDVQTQKMEHIIDILYKCRRNPHLNCP